ncbi:MAG: Gfo/Idh/MocA family protein [Phycisphaerales bacterium JB059]
MKSEPEMTRRDFVAAATAAGVGGLVASPAMGRGRGSGWAPLRVGIIGCGGRGVGALVQALKADPGVVLWAMGDLYPERIEPCLQHARDAIGAWAEERGASMREGKFSCPPERRFSGFEAYQQVIASGVDVVLLTTPPAFRPAHLRASVEAGKHVFCEKPVAVDAPGVRSVLDSARMAKEKGLSLMSGFCWRYQDQMREAFAQLLAGGVGEIRSIQTTYNTTGWVTPKAREAGWSDTEFQTRNWQYFHPLSGDHIVEQAVHAIDWIGWALRDRAPVRCWAVGGRQTRPDLPETGNVYDHFAVTYEFDGGVRAYHTCRHWPNTPYDNTGFVTGSEGTMTIDPWNGRHVIEGAKDWKGTAPGNDMYQREHDELFGAIRSGRPVNDGAFMANSTMLAIMGRMAAYTGQAVTWEQAMESREDLNPEAWVFGERPTPEVATPGRTRLI